MKTGKEIVLKELVEKAHALREWLLENSSPDTRAKEYCEVANEYAIIRCKIHLIEKN